MTKVFNRSAGTSLRFYTFIFLLLSACGQDITSRSGEHSNQFKHDSTKIEALRSLDLNGFLSNDSILVVYNRIKAICDSAISFTVNDALADYYLSKRASALYNIAYIQNATGLYSDALAIADSSRPESVIV